MMKTKRENVQAYRGFRIVRKWQKPTEVGPEPGDHPPPAAGRRRRARIAVLIQAYAAKKVLKTGIRSQTIQQLVGF